MSTKTMHWPTVELPNATECPNCHLKKAAMEKFIKLYLSSKKQMLQEANAYLKLQGKQDN